MPNFLGRLLLIVLGLLAPLGILEIGVRWLDLAPPPEQNPHPLLSEDGKILNHPANLLLAYDALTAIRGISREELATQVAENFVRLFG